MSRPNIVVFIPDQLRADALGCFGNPVVQTPVIDAFAASGTRFTQAFGQHPFCSQSRVAFLTGWYPHVHGHRTLTSLIKPWQPDVLGVLKAAGYHVAHVGLRGDTWAQGRTQESVSRFGWDVMPDRTWMRSPYGPDHPLGRAFYHGPRPEPVVDFDEASVQTAERWLADGLPEPWVLYVPLVFPHPPFEVEEPYYSRHDRASVPLPAPPQERGEALFKAEIRRRYGTDRLGESDWREIVATYYGMVARIDDHFGRILGAVERAGVEDRTAVFFFPDHGEYLGDAGLVEKWVSGMDDCLLRNPLIARIPGGPSGNVATGLTELVDITPTLCELAELDVPYVQFGRSLVPLLRDGAADHRDAAFSEGGLLAADADHAGDHPFPYDLKHGLESDRPDLAAKVVAVRTDDWTYVQRTVGGDELYDRRADPGERVNLIDDPAPTAVVSDLRARMLRWLTETSDVLPQEPDPRRDLVGASLPTKG